MNFKGKVCKKSGITLIALVITIIVLLILAGVSINILFGENGLLGMSESAKFKNEIARMQEEINLKKMEYTILQYEQSTLYVEYDFDNIVSEQYKDKFIVNNNGILIYIGDNDEERKCATEMNCMISINITTWNNNNLYNAIGDGMTDNTEAFKQCINYAQKNNYAIFIPNGNYLIKSKDEGIADNELVNLKDITIIGNSNENTLIVGTLKINSNCSVFNLNLTPSIGYYHTKTENILFSNCLFNQEYEDAYIAVRDSTLVGLSIINCKFIGRGINLVNKSCEEAYIRDIIIKNSYFEAGETGTIGIITRSYNSNPDIEYGFKNIQLLNSTFIGVENATDDMQINVSIDDGTDLITGAISRGVIVRDCTFINGTYAFENAGVQDLTFENNTVIGDISQSRLENEEANSKYLNNTITGKVSLQGNNILFEKNRINEQALVLREGNYNINNNILNKIIVNGGSGNIQNNTIETIDDIAIRFFNVEIVDYLYIDNNNLENYNNTRDIVHLSNNLPSWFSKYVVIEGENNIIKYTKIYNNINAIVKQNTDTTDDNDLKLILLGSGEMPDYSTTGAWWHYSGYASNITSLEIKSGITKIGNYNFYEFNINNIELPNTIEEIGIGAFAKCANLKNIFIPKSVEKVSSFLLNCSGVNVYCGAASKPNNWEDSWLIKNDLGDLAGNDYWNYTVQDYRNQIK